MYRIDQYQSPDRELFTCHTYHVAQYLLGRYLARYYNGVWCIGRIVETECYTDDDPACHAYRGTTERNASLFGPVGHTYVYMIYGMHACCNIVAYDSHQQKAGGVLIRAIAPVAGMHIMYRNRGLSIEQPSSRVTNGPGKLAQACAITRAHDGIDVCRNNDVMIVEDRDHVTPEIASSPRIGISQAQHLCWRFTIPHHPYLSR